jgi:predicted RNA-binding Zn-ribbon protein involved in translation (DUF1610 family)
MHEMTFNDVEAFIAERCRDLRCPACGGTHIEPAADAGEQPIALLFESSASRSWFGPPGYLRVFALNCAACGYMIIFRLEALEKWVRDRKSRAAAPRLPGRGGVDQPPKGRRPLLNATR